MAYGIAICDQRSQGCASICHQKSQGCSRTYVQCHVAMPFFSSYDDPFFEGGNIGASDEVPDVVWSTDMHKFVVHVQTIVNYFQLMQIKFHFQ